MYSAIRQLSRAEAWLVEAPACLGALLIAEAFYKFHSFTLEAGAFLATWFALGGLLATTRLLLSGR